jgi:hypothetical protein
VRRLIPLSLVSLLLIATLVVLCVSIQESARYSYFSPRVRGRASVVRLFHDAVNRTLGAKSFVLHEGHLAIQYQAPNRARSGVIGGPDIVIGDKSYWSLGTTNGVVRQFGEEPLTPLIDEFAGPEAAKATLRDLLRQQSVTKHGDTFTVQQVTSESKLLPQLAGQVLIEWTVTLRGGYVRHVRGVAHGILPSYLSPRHRSAPSVPSITLLPDTYTDFDDVQPINAPPKDKTVKMVPCADPSASITRNSKYVCGTVAS